MLPVLLTVVALPIAAAVLWVTPLGEGLRDLAHRRKYVALVLVCVVLTCHSLASTVLGESPSRR